MQEVAGARVEGLAIEVGSGHVPVDHPALVLELSGGADSFGHRKGSLAGKSE
jgi:hypothetical protein